MADTVRMIREKIKILGFDVDLFSFEEALEYVESFIENGQNAHVVTINPEIMELARKNSQLAKIINKAELVIPDGVGIKLACRLKGKAIEQIPGIDFSKKLVELCTKRGLAMGFLGAEEGVLQAAVENLTNEYPELKVAFQKNGFFKPEEEDEIVDKIAATPVKVMLIALGAPKQEFFIEKLKEKMNGAVLIGVGGSFDVWSGKVKRAPLWCRKMHCEWLYRIIKQPSRLKRAFLTLPLFLFRIIVELCKDRCKK